MRALITFTLSLLLTGVHATVWTVDNNSGTTANFSSISAAISGAASGDTIYVHKSMTSYGNFNINKHIVLLGPGHHSEGLENVNASVGNIELRSGCSGTYIGGLEIGSIIVRVFNVANNITIENNLFTGNGSISGAFGDNSMSDDWIISGNIFNPQSACANCKVINQNGGSSQNGVNENWVINNNIVKSVPLCCGSANYMFDYFNATSLIVNNTMMINSGTEVFSGSGDNNDAQFLNNIFIITGAESDVADHCTDCVFNNNLTYSTTTTLPVLPGSGNLDNQEPVFVSVPDYTTWLPDYDYHLTAGSPGTGAGTDGDDLGVYGGTFGFSKYGYPPGIPLVSDFNVMNPIVVEGQDLIITIRANTGN